MSRLTKKEKIKQYLERGFTDEDIWSIDFWFFEIMPKMIRELKKVYGGWHPTEMTCKQWEKILDRMIYCFEQVNERENDEFKFNKYDKEYNRLNKEFIKKYGLFGEKLVTEEEKAKLPKGQSIWKTMGHAPEKKFRDIQKKWLNESLRVHKEKEKFRKEAMDLFTKYLGYLWW